MKIFLDYGHGGVDSGAIGGGKKEKDINLLVGQRVAYHLKRHQQKIFESRTNDTNPTLTERSNLANRNNVDISISLHCNGFTDTNAKGFEIYTYDKQNRVLQFAECVRKSVITKKLYTSDRGIKQENLHMVREVKGLPILVEMGFITNEDDRKILSKTEELAIALTIGILKFFEIKFIYETKAIDNLFYRVQLGAFSKVQNAEKLQNELKVKNYNSIIKYSSRDNLYHVQIGAFNDKDNANKLQKELKLIGYNTIIKYY